MKARSKLLCEHSVGMALSAIEIYNKPDFKQREQVFAILVVAAWETLLKAKILKDAKNKPQSLWIPQDRRRRGDPTKTEPMTIGLNEALVRLELSAKVTENIRCMADIRNAAVHLMVESKALPRLVFGLGVATLQNYAKLAKSWFDVSLTEFHFFILPLGFAYPFHQFTLADLRKEPDDVARLLRAVSAAQVRNEPNPDGFELVCEIKMILASAKKLTDEPDIVASIGGDGDSAAIVSRVVNPLDKYPFSYRDVERRIKDRVPHATQHDIQRVIKAEKLKGDARYAHYHYRNKKDEAKGPNKGTLVIYNSDAVQFVVARLLAGVDDGR
jgi:hypothetical protein